MAFCAMFLLGLDVRFGMAAIIAATVIDWLFIAAPFIPDGGRDRRSGGLAIRRHSPGRETRGLLCACVPLPRGRTRMTVDRGKMTVRLRSGRGSAW
jgi:hypothetical protein